MGSVLVGYACVIEQTRTRDEGAAYTMLHVV